VGAEFSIWFLHPANGLTIAFIEQFAELSYTKVVNAVGAFTLKVPVNALKIVPLVPFLPGITLEFETVIEQDTRIVIWRKPANGVRAIDFVGFVRYVEKKAENDQVYFVMSGMDLNYLLDSRIVAYFAGSAQADKTDQADDMMKAIVRQNIGSGATDLNGDTSRDLSSRGLTVQADVGLGNSISKAFAYRNVLLVLQEISDASHETSESGSVYFGIVPLNQGWECEFRTNLQQWGLDHRYPSGAAGAVIFSLEFGDLADVSRYTDWRQETTYVYAGGQGENTLRDIQVASDTGRIGASPFNRREVFADARNVTTSAQVQDAAEAALREGRPRNLFSAKWVDATKVYGRDFNFGDYITAVYLGETVDCRIDAIVVTVVGSVERVDINLRSES